MKKKILSVLMVTALSISMLAGCGQSGGTSSGGVSSGGASGAASGSDSEYAMIAGTSTPDQHPYNLGLVKMGELIKEKTDGAVTLDVFGNSQLGNDAHMHA